MSAIMQGDIGPAPERGNPYAPDCQGVDADGMVSMCANASERWWWQESEPRRLIGDLVAKIDDLVQGFLAQRTIAVVGVSDRRETGCNLGYRKFKKAGYAVWPVNPRLTEFEGAACFPDLKSIPEKPDAVFILANPMVTEQIVQQCIELGVQHVWMHCMMGTKPGLASGMTSVSQEAVQRCREHGIAVIPGSCPNQFLNPDLGHSAMRVLWRALGFMKVNGSSKAEARA
ncbi:MAG: CoA-binding protein [Anaerolineales bacterium]|nr:CoA-binding protein [Anaerolineales bacterium]